MKFKTMDSADILKALDGETDIITPSLNAHQEYFDRLNCMRCGQKVMAITNERKPFRPDDLLPNFLAKCSHCGTEFEPYTKLEVTLPTFYEDNLVPS